MTPAGALELVGRPYRFPSSPPASFDCWSLARHVRAACFGLADGVAADGATPADFQDLARRYRPAWTETATPADGDLALIEDRHCGVVMLGGVLHCSAEAGAVRFVRLDVLKRAFPAVRFLRWPP